VLHKIKQFISVILTSIWILLCPIIFGGFVPLIYHFVIMRRKESDNAGDSAIIFVVYSVLWFWIHDKLSKRNPEWFI